MLQTMDQRTDNNPTGIRFILDQLGSNAPRYVREKTAGRPSTPHKFADSVNQYYPYDTPRDTWMSYAYLRTAGDSLTATQRKTIGHVLKVAAAYHDIEGDLCDIDMVLERRASVRAGSMCKFALTVSKHGEQHNLYPINSENSVRSSAHALAQAVDMPIEWKKYASEAIVDAAETFNIELQSLPEPVVRLGVRREPDFKFAADVARERGVLLHDRELGNLYTELVKSAEADDESQLPRYVDLMIELDRAQELEPYAKGVIDPYTAFYSGPEVALVEKAAKDNVYVMNALIPTEAFSNANEYVHEYFSKRAAESIQALVKRSNGDGVALSQELAKLPVKVQRELARIVIKHG